jgi:hypothetical protein
MYSLPLKAAFVAAVFAFHACPASAEEPLPEGAKGSFKINYVFTSSFSGGLSGGGQQSWNDKHVVTIVLPVKATGATEVSGLDGPSKKQMKKINANAKKGVDLGVRSKKVTDQMMPDIAAVMAKCGRDKACMERAAMAMTKRMDPKLLQESQQLSDEADAEMDTDLGTADFQLWTTSLSGASYEISETLNKSYFRITCAGGDCNYLSKVSGKGKIKTPFEPDAPVVEANLKNKTLTLVYPIFAFLPKVPQVVQTNDTSQFNGKRMVERSDNFQLKRMTLKCGATCRKASGQFSVNAKQSQTGHKGKLVVNWSFVVGG